MWVSLTKEVVKLERLWKRTRGFSMRALLDPRGLLWHCTFSCFKLPQLSKNVRSKPGMLTCLLRQNTLETFKHSNAFITLFVCLLLKHKACFPRLPITSLV